MTDAPELITERLCLRSISRASPAQMVAAITSDPAVMATLPGRDQTGDVHGQLAVANRYLDAFSEMWEPAGYGGWSIWHRDGDDSEARFVGFCGFIQPKIAAAGAELGYGIGRAWWRRGFAIEAATAAVRWLFEKPVAESIYAVTLADNRGSRRVLEKLGFEHLRDVGGADCQKWAGYGDLPLYTLHRDQWIQSS